MKKKVAYLGGIIQEMLQQVVQEDRVQITYMMFPVC